MRVICIDARDGVLGIASKMLCEGGSYTIIGCAIQGNGYLLKEVQHPFEPNWGWAKHRFVPISSIDETEFERNYNKELI